MSFIRYSSSILLLSLGLLQTSFAQSTTCFPLYGGDAFHPNGLFISLAPLKPVQHNVSSTYILQAGGSVSQAIWDATQGPYGIGPGPVQSVVQAEVSACIPAVPSGTIVPPPPPQSVPFTNTPFVTGADVLALGDFNRDGLLDIAVMPPGGNQVSIYLGSASGFQNPLITTFGNAATKLSAIVAADFNNDGKTDIAVLDTPNNAVYVIFNRGDGTMLNPATLSVGHSPASFTVADVNLDGNADLVVTNSADNNVSVMRGNGDGTFLPASLFAVGKNPVSVIVEDMNHDGNPDLVVADNTSSDIAVLFGFGNGGFQSAQFTKASTPPTFLASGDLNNDGAPDIVALAEDVNAVMTFLGSPQGKLTPIGAYLIPNLSACVSLNDFNGDGNVDVLIPDTDRGSPTLLLGRGDGTLIAPPVYGSSSGVTSIATGDVNKDGKADLVVTGSNTTTSSLSLLLGNGNGQFQSPVNIPVPGPTTAVALGSFRKTGLLDIAVAGTQLNILLNQGNGTFQQGAQYPNMVPSIVADFNKDGLPDIAGPANGTLTVLLGNGDGTFHTANPTNVGSNPKTAVAADFNKDGNLDAAVLNAGTIGSPSDQGSVSILLGTGAGTFSKVISVPAGLTPRAIAVGDMNGDGKTDLILATGATPANGATATAFQISVMLGNGDGTFQSPFNISLPAGETPETITVFDIDGDGNLDVVVGDCCADASVSYMRGNGDGTLQPPIPFYGGNDARAMIVGDWNGDGKPDLAIAYSPADNAQVSAIVPLVNQLKNQSGFSNTIAAGFVPGPMAADAIMAAFGSNLTTASASNSNPLSLPTTLANTIVTVKDSKGVTRQAELFFVSPAQVNYLVPDGTAVGPATVEIVAPNGVSSALVNTTNVAPGIFTVNSTGLAAATGTQVDGPFQSSFNVSYTDPFLGVQPVAINLGTRTDQNFLTLYGTGFRSRSSLNGVVVTLTPAQAVTGVYTPALYAGPQTQYPGLDQINIQIPQTLAGSGVTTIQVTVDGIAANPVNVTIQ